MKRVDPIGDLVVVGSVVSLIGLGVIIWVHWPEPPPVPRIENCVVISGERAIALGDFSEVRTDGDHVRFRNLSGSFWDGADWIEIRVPETHRAAVIEAFVRCRG